MFKLIHAYSEHGFEGAVLGALLLAELFEEDVYDEKVGGYECETGDHFLVALDGEGST